MVIKFERWFSPAGENRRIHMYLPNDYYYSDEKYPVLYMYDGHNLFYDSDATFGKCLGMREFMDGWNKPMIIVGLECSTEDVQRVHEYCPYLVHSSIYGDIHGRGDATVKWIVEELKPFIDSSFRTYPFRECTAIAGYSMGGMMTLYTILRYNNYFSKAAVISPSIVGAMDSFREQFKQPISADTRVFFSWGTAEYEGWYNDRVADCIYESEKAIQQYGGRTYLYRQEGGVHNEASWQYQVPTWMNFLWY